jgi:hypothetical protein
MAAKDHTPHLRVRIEPNLLARLEKARSKSGRTLTGEIVARLEHSFHRDDTKELLDEAALRFREQVLADLVSPDVTFWAAELAHADEMETSAAKTKNKEQRDKLLAEAGTIRTRIKELRLEDEKNAAERWRARLTSRKTEGE